MRAREFIGESVDLEIIHAEAVNEHLIDNPHLYESKEDFQSMREFLDANRTDIPTIGNFYAYTSVNSTPVIDFTIISHFNDKHRLLDIQNDVAYFDVYGEVRRFPEKGTLSGDALSQIYFFDLPDKVDTFVTALRLRFPNYKLKFKSLDGGKSILESKPVERNGVKLDVYMDGATVEIHAIDGGDRVGYVVFDRDGKDLTPSDLAVEPEYQRRGIASTMYDHAKSLGFKIHASSDQTNAGKQFWNKHRGKERVWENAVNKAQPNITANNMRANEFITEAEGVIKLRGPSEKAKAWIEKVYDLYPSTFQNNHVMVWGEGEDQQFAMFELVPSMSKRDAVEVKWFQAYPLRQGVGSRAMAELQRLAQEDGIALTLFPWDKGQVSQAKLMKFYKGHGFKPIAKGSKSMEWMPQMDESTEISSEIRGDTEYFYNVRDWKRRCKQLKLTIDPPQYIANAPSKKDKIYYSQNEDGSIGGRFMAWSTGGEGEISGHLSDKLEEEILDEGVELPNVVYHVTPARNLPSIQRHGLNPTVGGRSAKIQSESRAVFCFPSIEHVEDAIVNWLGDEFDEDEQLALLAINTKNLNGGYTPNAEYEIAITSTIPPSHIDVVTNDLDNHELHEEILGEGATSVLYHYTSTKGAYDILSSGEFKLSSVSGTRTEQQYAPEGYDYFLSTTRTRVGDYHRWVGSSAVMFVLDGDWFGQRYPVKPIDYWDRAWLHSPGRTREAEDRVFSKSPSIPIGGIRQVHVLLTEQQEYRSPMTRKLLILAKQQGIDTFLYADKKAWLLQDTRRAISPEEAKDLLKGQDPTKSHREPLDYLSPWIELINKTKKSQLTKKADKLRYNIVYYGGDGGLSNEMSNARKPGNDGYENAIKINNYMRQNKFKSLEELAAALKEKWKNITD